LLAGALAHEKGHCFGACMMLATACADNLLAKAALHFYTNSERTEDRVVVLQDIASILDLDKKKQSELQVIANDPDAKAVIMYFGKLTSQRNTSRALSVGVERMSSEVVADMYAIRMGFGKDVIAAIAIMVDTGCIEVVLSGILIAAVQTIFIGLMTLPSLLSAIIVGVPAIVLITGGLIIFTFMYLFNYFSRGYAGVYNADHRRFDDALRQMIAKLREDKNMDNKAKAELVKDLENLVKINDKLKPWYDNTVIHRFFGWMMSGNDFRLQEVEHYTSVLANHELNLIPAQLQALR